MTQLLRLAFYTVFVRLITHIVLGLNVRHRERLPTKGPCVLVANHNSHLDTMVLMTLLPTKVLSITHPVAAADYFLRNRLFAWFATKVVGILPIRRVVKRGDPHPLTPCFEALDAGRILILFPEGTRGEPEQRSDFKNGIARLVKDYPNVPVIPIYLHGLGKALPKGEALLVPFFCDVFVGEPIPWTANRKEYMATLEDRFEALAKEGRQALWE